MIHHSGRQAISTKFLGPANCRGSRIKATAQAGSITVSFDHSLSSADAHAKAAQALIEKFGWDSSDWVSAGHPSGSGYVFVPLTHEVTPAAERWW